jgi:lipoyl(octanoyl) transferase
VSEARPHVLRGPWRLVVDSEPGRGAWNMALDRAIQLAHEAGECPPTLRLYGWERPTATLGRFQSAETLDRAACERYGVDVVRRFTGGRGVLHDDEVTYSIVAGLSTGLPRGTAASYRILCGALTEAYHDLGVQAQLTPRERGVQGSAACYLHSTQADLSLGARKLSGSAQVWTGSTALQHGSFVLTRDVAREAAVFRLDAAAERRLTDDALSLAEALGARPDREAVVEAVVGGVSRALGVELVPGSVTQAECALAEGLLGEVDVVGPRSQ